MSLKKLEANQSQKTIINALLDGPMTFSELLEKSGISRAVFNKHLKALEKQGVIKKIYKDGKILNVLNLEKLDFIEWFLNLFSPFGLPEEVIQRGRKILTKKFIVTNCIAVTDRLKDIIDELIEETHGKSNIDDFTNWLGISYYLSQPQYVVDLKTSIFGSREDVALEISNIFLNDLNISIVSAGIVYMACIQKLFTENNFIKAPTKIKRESEIISWWLNEAFPYMTSKRVFFGLGVLAYLRDKKEIERFMEYVKKDEAITSQGGKLELPESEKFDPSLVRICCWLSGR